MNLPKITRRFLFFLLTIPIFLSTIFLLVQTPNSRLAKTASLASDSSDEDVTFFSREFPIVSAQGVYAYDLATKEVLYEKDAESAFFPASTTKIITALVALDFFNLEDKLNTGEFYVIGSKMGLSWNETITVRNLLYGLLISSGNDAAEVLAANYEGGREEFIRAMNKKAKEIGAVNTNFVNPSGLDSSDQTTTARDLAIISAYAMENSIFAKIVATESFVAKDVGGSKIHYLKNKNELLGKVPGVAGVKTGWTENARENLVTFIERNGRRVIIAVLGSQDRFGETKELIEWIFETYWGKP